MWSHSSVANILANGANDWWYSGWGYPNYYCKVQLFFSSAPCDSNSQNTQPEPGTCTARSGSANTVAQFSET
jgi:hypothetical protein